MKHLVKNLFLFIIINLIILCIVLQIIHYAFVQKNWDSDPDIFIIPSQQEYQFVIMGTSHAVVFSRYDNQKIVESIVDQKFLNISQPDAGPVMEKVYLQFFLERENTANTIIYFIDPHVFYSDKWNENYYLLPYGELDPHFLQTSIKNTIGYTTTLDYIKSYISLKWFIKNPRPDTHDYREWVPKEADVATRRKKLFPEEVNNATFEKYALVLDEITEQAQKNNINLVFIIPPTLINNQPGMMELKNLLQEYKKEKHINFYDLSSAIKNPKLYSDPDHLNTKGVELFTKIYLRHLPELQN